MVPTIIAGRVEGHKREVVHHWEEDRVRPRELFVLREVLAGTLGRPGDRTIGSKGKAFACSRLIRRTGHVSARVRRRRLYNSIVGMSINEYGRQIIILLKVLVSKSFCLPLRRR